MTHPVPVGLNYMGLVPGVGLCKVVRVGATVGLSRASIFIRGGHPIKIQLKGNYRDIGNQGVGSGHESKSRI